MKVLICLHLLKELEKSNAKIAELEKSEIDHKKVEKALKESEKKVQKILATVPLGIGLIVNRELRWSNDRMYAMLGYPNGGLFGESARILYENENEYNRVGKIIYEMIRKNGICEVETQWKRKVMMLKMAFQLMKSRIHEM